MFTGAAGIVAVVRHGLPERLDELPAYVVLPYARCLPSGTTSNWTNGWLPARHQGVAFRTKGAPISDLFPSRPIEAATDQASRELLSELNQRHFDERDADDALGARIRAYQLAAKMQLAVPEVTDLAGETAGTREMYGLDDAKTADFGRNCLLARRLLEKGVRMVQLFSGGAFGSPRINWDGHENVQENHSREAERIDQPIAALLRDLRQRGMLDDTLVLFTTEFGRTPFTEQFAGVTSPPSGETVFVVAVVAVGGWASRGRVQATCRQRNTSDGSCGIPRGLSWRYFSPWRRPSSLTAYFSMKSNTGSTAIGAARRKSRSRLRRGLIVAGGSRLPSPARKPASCELHEPRGERPSDRRVILNGDDWRPTW